MSSPKEYDLTPNKIAPDPFFEIVTNRFVSRPRKSINTEDDIFECDCKPYLKQFCDDGCLNRRDCVECDARKCLNGEKCCNRRFQTHSWADVEIQSAGKKGWGLYAKQSIAKHTFIIEYCGEIINQVQVQQRLKERYYGSRKFFILSLGGGDFIDATMLGCKARFMNHSCEPNCYVEPWSVRGERCIGIFAKRDIEQGEELTFDYQFQRYSEDYRHPCFCGSAKCRKLLGAKAVSNRGTNNQPGGGGGGSATHHPNGHPHSSSNHNRVIYRRMTHQAQLHRHSAYAHMQYKLTSSLSSSGKSDILNQMVLRGRLLCKPVTAQHSWRGQESHSLFDARAPIAAMRAQCQFDHALYLLGTQHAVSSVDQLRQFAWHLYHRTCENDTDTTHDAHANGKSILCRMYGEDSRHEQTVPLQLSVPSPSPDPIETEPSPIESETQTAAVEMTSASPKCMSPESNASSHSQLLDSEPEAVYERKISPVSTDSLTTPVSPKAHENDDDARQTPPIIIGRKRKRSDDDDDDDDDDDSDDEHSETPVVVFKRHRTKDSYVSHPERFERDHDYRERKSSTSPRRKRRKERERDREQKHMYKHNREHAYDNNEMQQQQQQHQRPPHTVQDSRRWQQGPPHTQYHLHAQNNRTHRHSFHPKQFAPVLRVYYRQNIAQKTNHNFRVDAQCHCNRCRKERILRSVIAISELNTTSVDIAISGRKEYYARRSQCP